MFNKIQGFSKLSRPRTDTFNISVACCFSVIPVTLLFRSPWLLLIVMDGITIILTDNRIFQDNFIKFMN